MMTYEQVASKLREMGVSDVEDGMVYLTGRADAVTQDFLLLPIKEQCRVLMFINKHWQVIATEREIVNTAAKWRRYSDLYAGTSFSDVASFIFLPRNDGCLMTDLYAVALKHRGDPRVAVFLSQYQTATEWLRTSRTKTALKIKEFLKDRGIAVPQERKL